MPAKDLVIQKSARKQLLKLPISIHKKIVKSLDNIQNNPIAAPKLQGKLKNYHKLRVGDYRIVYKFDSNKSVVEVVKIEHRQGVYK